MNETIRIEIGENEWKAFPASKRERIKNILKERYGYNIESILNVEEDEE